jgi:hypothetical protein
MKVDTELLCARCSNRVAPARFGLGCRRCVMFILLPSPLILRTHTLFLWFCLRIDLV